ncbi:MAG: phosphate signaling complex protein PhoU [Erysipelothrix sp.]|nr:phosphate signaling complex protein PhoU [Erysipelothrix sp.]
MKTVLDSQLIILKNNISEMALLCEQALTKAMRSLSEGDVSLAKEIIAYDEHINNMEKEIQSLCYSLLVRQHPVASDFRFLSASLKIVTDLERIGDYATDISEIVIEYSHEDFVYQKQLVKMCKDVIIMLKDVIESLMSMDETLADQVINYDDNIDNALLNLKLQLVNDMINIEDYHESLLDAFMIAKYFERCGDRCVNIAKSVIFFKTGQ